MHSTMSQSLARHTSALQNSSKCLRHIRARQVVAFHIREKRSNSTRSAAQAIPLHGYYQDMLDTPLHSIYPATKIPPTPRPQTQEGVPKTEKDERLAKARVVFGSRLAGPVERQQRIDAESQMIAGILVPPKPVEPDNCCMSGCVNCVWDQYRDELEEWAAKSLQAKRKLSANRMKGSATGMMAKEKGMPAHTAISMDDDGGGSETNWVELESAPDADGPSEKDLFKDIPVGIREFMKTEKLLKQKHAAAQTSSF